MLEGIASPWRPGELRTHADTTPAQRRPSTPRGASSGTGPYSPKA